MLARIVFEIFYNFIFYGGLIITALAIVAAFVALLWRLALPATNWTGAFLKIWAGLLLAGAPLSWLYASRLRTWELEKIAERCGDDFGCESAFYFGGAYGMAVIGALALLALWRRRKQRKPVA